MRGTAIVVGGGIGGLATARAFTRTGWQVTLYEQVQRFEPVGAGITLAPNAVRVLDWLGLGEQLRARAMAHGAAGLRTTSGRWLMRTTTPPTSLTESPSSTPPLRPMPAPSNSRPADQESPQHRIQLA